MNNYDNKDTRIETCNKIRERLLFLEKYSTGKDNMTYMMIPFDHPVYKYPFNLQDRITYVEDRLNKLNRSNIKLKFKKGNNGLFEGKRDKKYVTYTVEFTYSKQFKEKSQELLDYYLFKKKGNKWTAVFE